MEYQSLQIKEVPVRALDKTAENVRWWAFEKKATVSHFGQVRCIHICPSSPYLIAVSNFDQVTVYNPSTYDVAFTESHFKEGVNTCRFRSDGRLMVGAGDFPRIRVWTVKPVAMVRELMGHSRAIHQTWFMPNKMHIMSCSDDMTAKIWDITTYSCIQTLAGHTDYVRAAAPHPFDVNLIATGGYDRSIRLWDLRASPAQCVMQASADAGVEVVTWHPSGSYLASGAGSVVSVWDCVAGRVQKLVSGSTEQNAHDTTESGVVPLCEPSPAFKANNHQKTITSLVYNKVGSRLLSGGLDHFVKVYNTQTYAAVHTMTYPAPVLAVALSPDGNELVVGMQDGKTTFSCAPFVVPPAQRMNMETRKDAELFEDLRGYLYKPQPVKHWDRHLHTSPDQHDLVIASNQRKRLAKYDIYLKKFRYHDALDQCMRIYFLKKTDVNKMVVISMLEELLRRNGLRIALVGRTEQELLPLLMFLGPLVSDPRFSSLTTSVLELILEIYAGVVHCSAEITAQLRMIEERLRWQVGFLDDLSVVDGMLDCVAASAGVQSHREHTAALYEEPTREAAA